MGRVFVIADTHFGHAKMADLRGFASIEEHDAALVERWNAVVTKRDTVWHLGDVLFGKHSFAVLPRLLGIKKLVLGNHDQYPIADYAAHFSKVCAGFALRDVLLTHIPVHESQASRWRVNIHGHRHAAPSLGDWYRCVSVEQTAMRPVLLDAVLSEVPHA